MFLRILKNFIVNTQHSGGTIKVALFALFCSFYSFFSNVRPFLFLCFLLIMCFAYLYVYNLFIAAEDSKTDEFQSLILGLLELKIQRLTSIRDLNKVILELTGLFLSVYLTVLLRIDTRTYNYFLYSIDFSPVYKNFLI